MVEASADRVTAVGSAAQQQQCLSSMWTHADSVWVCYHARQDVTARAASQPPGSDRLRPAEVLEQLAASWLCRHLANGYA
jgi:hypothetical protein